uniref:DNA polymerase I, thermostable n=1 Tax=Magallana gigas TaxID=29159 RepID=K1Q3B5_MAGGI
MPEDLSPQIYLAKKIAPKLGLQVVEADGAEADDIIASYVSAAPLGQKIQICSSDKDLFQLIKEDVSIIPPSDISTEQFKDDVIKKFGVGPEQIVDLLALVGDSSDNIKGVPGIGFKTAGKLLSEFKTVEEIFENLDSLSTKQAESIKENFARILINRQLIRLFTNVPIPNLITKEELVDSQGAQEMLRELHFNSILKSFEYSEPHTQQLLNTQLEEEREQEKLKAQKWSRKTFESIKRKKASISLGYKEDRLINILVYTDSECVLIEKEEDIRDFLGSIETMDDRNILIFDLKQLYRICLKSGLPTPKSTKFIDIKLALYLLNPNERPSESRLCQKHGANIPDLQEVASIDFAKLIWKEYPKIESEIKLLKLDGILFSLDIPLALVVAEMENKGILFDKNKLQELETRFSHLRDQEEKKIFEISKEQCNLSSSKQLADLLFNKMGLTPIKNKKTGFSTDHESLLSLKKEHPIIEHIILLREMDKLISTYIVGTYKFIDERTGRVHPSFDITGTSTGRLSCKSPNMQNIPIRSKYGAEIRSAIVSPPEHMLISADYSQIEIRVLAYLCKSEKMNEFLAHGDIHQMTAAKIFNIAPNIVSTEQRRIAKTINFGILYGQTPFGLAKELNISKSDAVQIIQDYYTQFPEIEETQEELISKARENGYSETILGRKRPIKEIFSKNKNIQKQAERFAVNSVIQGSAADIIRSSMLAFREMTMKKNIPATIIMQIHDELVVETPKSHVNDTIDILKTCMEKTIDLQGTPTPINLHIGHTWKSD